MKASASQVTPCNSPGAQILQRKVASDHPEGVLDSRSGLVRRAGGDGVVEPERTRSMS